MKKNVIYFLILIQIMACNNKKSVSSWSYQQINNWFNQSEWVKLPVIPDSSINKKLFVEQNILNPTSWKAACKFLKENDFSKMQEGRYELDKNGTFATVTDYFTKDLDTAYYEAHRKFIDIQYVSSGREYIGLTALDNVDSVKQEYDETKDIGFFQKPNLKMLLADSTKFFVFFPENGHKPCLKVDKNSKVRKIVIKIPVVENR